MMVKIISRLYLWWAIIMGYDLENLLNLDVLEFS